MATYTVKQGDTLSEIAWRYNSTYNYGSTAMDAAKRLAEINDIDNINLIYIGQVLTLDNPSGSITKKKNNSNKAIIKQFGYQSNSDRTIFAVWSWDKSYTDNYRVIWKYYTGNKGVWFVGSDSTVTDKQSTYNIPDNATRIYFIVKPISKTKTVNNKETSYWTAEWSTGKYYNVSDLPPTKPSTPEVNIDNLNLTAELNNIDIGNAKEIEFQIIRNDTFTFKTGKATIKTNSASFSCSITAGSEYKVRCRGIRDKIRGPWSDYSENKGTAPEAPKNIISLKALSETSVFIDWDNVKNAKNYEVQYTTKKSYFDSSTEVKSITVDATVAGHAEVTGLESGEEYFFRVRATNDKGKSSWSEIKSIVIGKKPSAPTTWSSTTTVITGEPLTLYWVHNSEDGSNQTYAELELTINGAKETHTIKNTENEDEKDKTSSYSINTSSYSEGSKIQWRVRTAGITKTYGDWSVERIIDIYAPATLELSMTDNNGNAIETLTSFPFYISGLAGPNTQEPIGYHLSIVSNEIYETVDQIGNKKIINKGECVYFKYFDTSDALLVEFLPGNIDLENNISYTITCTVSMNSGLRTESSLEFVVAWEDDILIPNAEIGYDNESYSTHIRPYCVDEDGNLIDDISLSVYRREFDGSFVEIASGLNNTSNTYVTDPHPALDYARYRIVAITNSTGAVGYYDVPGYPVGEIAAIVQWNEEWSDFDSSTVNEADETEQPAWSGSLLRLPYNIDVSDKNSLDVSLVEYVGRKRPVSYYGTQLGESSSWKVEIPKDDKETLYGLRRLAIWPGDVYVREPSGSGYWAHITVSFSQTHCELTIPVSLELTRVEGGI